MELAGLFLWSFLAATILPLGSEPALAAIVARRGTFLLPVVIATAGNYLGACTTFFLARMAASLSEKKQKDSRWFARAADLVRRYGAPALLLSWVPLIGDAIVAAAGAAAMPFLRFSIFTLIGKAARYAVLALIVAGLWR